MFKKIQQISFAFFLTILTTPSVLASPLPGTNENGDYITGDHYYWEVVDPDPNGLNCRTVNATIYELLQLNNPTPFDFFNWPVVGVLYQGQRFHVSSSNRGVFWWDTRKLPWLYVKDSDQGNVTKGCFVRANSQYVKPVPLFYD